MKFVISYRIFFLFSWFRQDPHSFADDAQHNLVSPPSYGG